MRHTIITGDCREVSPPAEPYVVITDPPWPAASAPVIGCERAAELLAEAMKVYATAIRVAVIVGCNSDPAMLGTIGRQWPFFRHVMMEYAVPHYSGRLLYTHDCAYLFGPPPASREGGRVIAGKSMDSSSGGKQSRHPCPRKENHMRWLVDKWSEPDELIVDPFAGSGTTLVAAKGLGRSGLGYEIDPVYADEARSRLCQESVFEAMS